MAHFFFAALFSGETLIMQAAHKLCKMVNSIMFNEDRETTHGEQLSPKSGGRRVSKESET